MRFPLKSKQHGSLRRKWTKPREISIFKNRKGKILEVKWIEKETKSQEEIQSEKQRHRVLRRAQETLSNALRLSKRSPER